MKWNNPELSNDIVPTSDWKYVNDAVFGVSFFLLNNTYIWQIQKKITNNNVNRVKIPEIKEGWEGEPS